MFGSKRYLEQARMIGADRVVDYTEDFTREGRTHDLICDMMASRSVSDYKRALKPGGSCLIVGLPGNPLLGLVKYTVRETRIDDEQEGRVHGNR